MAIPFRSVALFVATLYSASTCTRATAQAVSATFIANTALSVAAGPTIQSIPAGTNLAGPHTSLSAASPNGLGGAVVSITYQHSPQTGTRLTIHDNANMQVPGETASIGTHETLLLLTSPQPVMATATLSYSAFASLWPQNASAQGMIDVGNDGVFELVGSLGGAPAEVELTIVIPPQGIAIRTVTSGASVHPPGAQSRVQYLSSLGISIKPIATCAVTIGGGTGCLAAFGPSTFAETSFANELIITTETFAPNAPVFTAIGAAPLDARIPGTFCNLLVDPFVILSGTADSGGRTTFSVPIPVGQTIQAFFQHLVLAPQVFASPLVAGGRVTLNCP